MSSTALPSPAIAPPAAPLILPTGEAMPPLLRPPRGVSDLAQQLDHPSGYLALSSGNQHFVLPAVPGFIAYRPQGRHLFLFGGVHGGPATWQPLLDAFLAYAAGQRRAVVAVQLRAPQLALFAERGFTVNPLGTSFGLHLPDFRLAGTRRMKLRNKIVRARRLGLQVREVGPELPRSPATWAALSAISDSWLRRKGKKELDFMIGELGRPDEAQRRVFVVQYADAATGSGYRHSGQNELGDNWVGFITYVPVYGQYPGYLHDLTRRLPAAPPGAMELCNAEAMTRLQAEGTRYLHFGFTPFVTGESLGHLGPAIAALPSVNSSRWLDRAIRLLHRYGRAIYPAQSQADYKRKWGPDLIEPEYVAARPLSLRAIWDLLRLTRSL